MHGTSSLIDEREAAILAPYAMRSRDSRGRQHSEAEHPYRGPYQRDRDRILHSSAFRRLSHKTQVFTGEMGDYHRTRLTHTLEVASIARTIARALRLNEDLVEALALAHDLGHPPFGHSGEDVLDECLRDHGGFNHNAQGLRICELLETSYRKFPGLNLTHEVLDGQRRRSEKRSKSLARGTADAAPSPLLEVQAVDIADSIAYDAHDADDALELGLLESDQLLDVALWREAGERVQERASSLSERQLRRAIVHEVIDWQVSDVIEETRRLLSLHTVSDVAGVRKSSLLVRPSAALAEKKTILERFLFDNVYRHPEVLTKRRPAQAALRESFAALVADPRKLPAKFQRLAESEGLPRAVGDYLAGMTDRFAMDEYHRLVGDEPPLVAPRAG
jgi:dGTPase